MLAETCSCCDRSFSPDDIVTLWDGQHYCRECTEDTCQGLFNYARRYPVLEETAPPDWQSAFVFTCLVSCTAVGGLAGVLMILAWLSGDFLQFLGMLPDLWGLGTALWLFAFGYGCFDIWRGNRGRPSIRVHDGLVTVSRGRGRCHRTIHLSEYS